LLTPPERAYSCRDSNPRWGIVQWQVIMHLDNAGLQLKFKSRVIFLIFAAPIVIIFAFGTLKYLSPKAYYFLIIEDGPI